MRNDRSFDTCQGRHESLRGANGMVGTAMQPCRSRLVVSLESTLKPVGKAIYLSPSRLPEVHLVR
jgi:hypothetical protein